MSIGTQVDLDWAGVDAAPGGAQAPSRTSPGSALEAKYLTDEEILGIEPVGSDRTGDDFVIPSEGRNRSSIADGSEDGPERDSSRETRARNDKNGGAATNPENRDAEPLAENTAQAKAPTTQGMPLWMAAAASDPRHSAEARDLWREHQEFRAAFASPEEARAVKELLPGGVRDVLSLREATQSVERIDAALFSGDARAQAEVVAELARANPAAFRALFAEAAKVVAGLGGSEAAGSDSRDDDGPGQGADDRRGDRGHSGGAREHRSAPPHRAQAIRRRVIRRTCRVARPPAEAARRDLILRRTRNLSGRRTTLSRATCEVRSTTRWRA